MLGIGPSVVPVNWGGEVTPPSVPGDGGGWETGNNDVEESAEQTTEGPLSEITPTGLLVSHVLQSVPFQVTVGRKYTVSVVVRPTGLAHLDLAFASGPFADGAGASINLLTHAVHSVGAANPVVTIVDLGANLLRINLAAVAIATGQSRIRISVLDLLFAGIFTNLTSAYVRIGTVRVV